MDPLVAAAGRVVGYLVPYVLDKGIDLASKLGKNAVDKVAAWLDSLRRKWADDEEASAVLAEFEQQEAANADRLRDVLADRMGKDPSLKESTEELANDVGPKVVVVMRGGEVLVQEGPEFAAVLRGAVNVEMDLVKGERQRGPTFGPIG
jgi:hypothetical protein